MNVQGIFEQETKEAFCSPVREFFVLAGKGGGAFQAKSKKYYIVTKNAAAVYDPESDEVIDNTVILRWPISVSEYQEQGSTQAYFHRFQEALLYRITGAFYENPNGAVRFLYVKSAQEIEKTDTKLDEIREKYLQLVKKNDEILGELTLDKAMGEFRGSVLFEDASVEIFAAVEWNDETSWEAPLQAAREFVRNIGENDKIARSYVAESVFFDDDLSEDIEYYSREIGVEPIDTAEKMEDYLQGRLKYIYVDPEGSYTISYDDGDLFGGHEITISVDADGEYDGWDIVG